MVNLMPSMEQNFHISDSVVVKRHVSGPVLALSGSFQRILGSICFCLFDVFQHIVSGILDAIVAHPNDRRELPSAVFGLLLNRLLLDERRDLGV